MSNNFDAVDFEPHGLKSSDLGCLISERKELQKKIEFFLKQDPQQEFSSTNSRELTDELEGALQDQQSDIMKKIIALECRSTADVLAKFDVWKQCKTLGNTSLERFSLTDQIALSAIW